MQIVEALNTARREFESSERLASDSAQLDAEVLLCSVLKCERTYLYAYPEKEVSEQEFNELNKLISLRSAGHPVAHLVKQREFWSLLFHVNEHTLIPRPETEILVETALNFISKDSKNNILDLGTGSGAIAISIASERPLINITATDNSEAALNIAIQNAERHQIKNINFIQADWFNMDNTLSYDVIVSNPPYICHDDPHLSEGDVQFEPLSALASGEDGLDDLKIIIPESLKHLKQRGWLLVEHGYNQAKQVQQLFNENNFATVTTIKDYSDNDRVTTGQKL